MYSMIVSIAIALLVGCVLAQENEVAAKCGRVYLVLDAKSNTFVGSLNRVLCVVAFTLSRTANAHTHQISPQRRIEINR